MRVKTRIESFYHLDLRAKYQEKFPLLQTIGRIQLQIYSRLFLSA